MLEVTSLSQGHPSHQVTHTAQHPQVHWKRHQKRHLLRNHDGSGQSRRTSPPGPLTAGSTNDRELRAPTHAKTRPGTRPHASRPVALGESEASPTKNPESHVRTRPGPPRVRASPWTAVPALGLDASRGDMRSWGLCVEQEERAPPAGAGLPNAPRRGGPCRVPARGPPALGSDLPPSGAACPQPQGAQPFREPRLCRAGPCLLLRQRTRPPCPSTAAKANESNGTLALGREVSPAPAPDTGPGEVASYTVAWKSGA